MSLILNSQFNSITSSSQVVALDGNTGALVLPKGNTLSRPSSPRTGMLRYNSDNASPEFYNGTSWSNFFSSSTVTSASAGSGTTNSIARFADASGTNIITSGATIDNASNIAGVATLNAKNINLTAGSTLPANGFYLVGSNTLGVAANSLPVAQFSNPNSAVNYLIISGNTTTGNPSITALGADNNIGVSISAKGSGQVSLLTNSGSNYLAYFGPDILGTNQVNYLSFNSSSPGGAPGVQTWGSDSNISLSIAAKGAGAVLMPTSGVVVGNPLGGNQGSGSINAQSMYINGSPIIAQNNNGTLNALVVGSPSGGNEGAGSINAQSIYINGTAVNPGGALLTPYAVGAFAFAATAYGAGTYSGSVLYNAQGGTWRQIDYVLTYNDGHGGLRWITMFQRIA